CNLHMLARRLKQAPRPGTQHFANEEPPCLSFACFSEVMSSGNLERKATKARGTKPQSGAKINRRLMDCQPLYYQQVIKPGLNFANSFPVNRFAPKPWKLAFRACGRVPHCSRPFCGGLDSARGRPRAHSSEV